MLDVEAVSFPLAACRAPGVDRAWFFPGPWQGDAVRAAQAVCAGCAEREACAEHALGDPGLVGIWGGLTDEARKAERRRRRLAAVTDLALDPPTATGHEPEAVAEAAGDRACEHCGTSMVGADPRRRYCSDACSADARRDRRRTPGDRAAVKPGPGKRHRSSAGGVTAPAAPIPHEGDRLGEVVATLVAAGLAVSVDVDGVTLNVRAG